MCLTCKVHIMHIMGMTLQEFLTLKNLSDPDFGVLIGRDRTTVMRLRRGDTKPDWKTMEAIVSATQGEVTPNDFLESLAVDGAQSISGEAA